MTRERSSQFVGAHHPRGLIERDVDLANTVSGVDGAGEKCAKADQEYRPVHCRCRKIPATRAPTPSPECCAAPGPSDRTRAPSLVKGRSADRRISRARHPSQNRQIRATCWPRHGRAKCRNIAPPHQSRPSPDRTRPPGPSEGGGKTFRRTKPISLQICHSSRIATGNIAYCSTSDARCHGCLGFTAGDD